MGDVADMILDGTLCEDCESVTNEARANAYIAAVCMGVAKLASPRGYTIESIEIRPTGVRGAASALEFQLRVVTDGKLWRAMGSYKLDRYGWDSCVLPDFVAMEIFSTAERAHEDVVRFGLSELPPMPWEDVE